MVGIRFEPVDSWFFRDATPFSADSDHADSDQQSNVESLFPPHPTTATGALRAALAVGMGWSGHGRWPDAISDVLGDGPENLGKFSMRGPFLLKDEKPLFPAPAHLLGSGDSGEWEPAAFLFPGPEVECDLGEAVRLPCANSEGEGLRTGDKKWITQNGMNKICRGEFPGKDDIVPDKKLWAEETRIGLKRNRQTRSAKESMLYSTRHVRLKEGVSLGVQMTELLGDCTLSLSGQLIPFGGEARLAECLEWEGEVTFGSGWRKGFSRGQLTLIALSPLDIDKDVYTGRRLFELGSFGNIRVVSACLNHPQRIGGWDSVMHKPLPLRSLLPRGSVLFCEINKCSEDALATGNGLASVGLRQRHGFGLVALGCWPENNRR